MNKDKEIIQALNQIQTDSEQIAQWAEQQKKVLDKLPEVSEEILKQQKTLNENMGKIASQLDAFWEALSKK
ncbi:TPA: hypothetical protein ACVOY8_000013 [Vibrio diabolicus]